MDLNGAAVTPGPREQVGYVWLAKKLNEMALGNPLVPRITPAQVQQVFLFLPSFGGTFRQTFKIKTQWKSPDAMID